MLNSNRVPSIFMERFFAALVPYYQCDVNCILEFRGPMDIPRITNAFLAALAEQPLWAHRFVPAFWRPYWLLIPQAERKALVEVIAAEEPSAAIQRILRGSIDAAARLYILHGSTGGTLFFQLDHRLADATAARLLIESVRAHYAASDPVPAEDAPLVRHSMQQLPPAFPSPQRRKAFALIRQHNRTINRAPVPCYLPPITKDDPADLAPVLDFPDGALDQLRTRAAHDYATPTLAILAATYLALREVIGIAPQAPVSLWMLVDLRRYLPAKLLPAPASVFVGQVPLQVQEQGADTMAMVMQQLWTELAKQRGPHFGLTRLKLFLEVPLLRFLAEWMPFTVIKAVISRRCKIRTLPKIFISDLCELGRPGDRWDEVELENAGFGLGVWGIPGVINVFSGTCGSRMRIIVGTAPRSFATQLAAAIHRHLSHYVGWPVPSES